MGMKEELKADLYYSLPKNQPYEEAFRGQYLI